MGAEIPGLSPLRAGDPEQLGPWRLIGRLGSGGMGLVFLGETKGGVRAAVKTIRPDVADVPQFRSRWESEIEAARRVSSSRVARYISADPSDSVPWLATEFIEGPTLLEAVVPAGLSLGDVRSIAAGLIESLELIHASGVTHRDLKPSNVILADWGPVVIDFGISKSFEDAAATTSHVRMGSPGFMSPEQISGEPVGPESDVFSWGCTVCFAASGESPFGNGRPETLAYRVVHADPEVPPLGELNSLVSAALRKSPRARPSAASIRRALGAAPLAHLANPTDVAGPPHDVSGTQVSEVKAAGRTSRKLGEAKSPMRGLLLIGLLVVVLAGLAGAIAGLLREPIPAFNVEADSPSASAAEGELGPLPADVDPGSTDLGGSSVEATGRSAQGPGFSEGDIIPPVDLTSHVFSGYATVYDQFLAGNFPAIDDDLSEMERVTGTRWSREMLFALGASTCNDWEASYAESSERIVTSKGRRDWAEAIAEALNLTVDQALRAVGTNLAFVYRASCG